MTHRIEMSGDHDTARIAFHGVLDRTALEDILACACKARRQGARRVTLILEAGTEVCRECIEPLRNAEGLAVEPASAFLARWLRQEDGK